VKEKGIGQSKDHPIISNQKSVPSV
jgi:hypothetical protein